VGRERLRHWIPSIAWRAGEEQLADRARDSAGGDGVLMKGAAAVELNQVDRRGTVDTVAAARIVVHRMGFWQRPSIITR
jgi:hypothetical protein